MAIFDGLRTAFAPQLANCGLIAPAFPVGPFCFYNSYVGSIVGSRKAAPTTLEQNVSNNFDAVSESQRDRSVRPTKPFRILIADDHEALRRGLRSALLGAGWQVIGEASDGKETIEKVRELKPDLLLLDLSMPIMSGHDAAREILRTNPDVKIVVFTMHESQQVRDALRKIGVHALAVKSAPLSLLLDTIQNVLDGEKN